MQVTYLGADNLSPEAFLRIKTVVTQHLPLLPSWLLELVVVCSLDTDASMATDTAYSSATLRLGQSHAAQRYDELSLTIIHEFMHVHLAPIMSMVQQARKYPSSDEQPNDLFDSVLTEKHERSTQELAHLILRLTNKRRDA